MQKQEDNGLTQLKAKLKHADICCDANSSDAAMSEEMILRTEYEELIDYKTKGAIVRSRVNLYEYGERSSKYLLNLENRKKKTEKSEEVEISRQ